ncbi:MAG: hypothetical protein ACLVIY_13010 [Anaerobutyricum soehngenii]
MAILEQEYKGFLTKDEAEAFLNIGKITKGNMIITEMDVSEKMNETISDKIRSTTDKLIVYVDGSFDIHLQKYSFGCVIFTGRWKNPRAIWKW